MLNVWTRSFLNKIDNHPEPQEHRPVEPLSTADQINIILQELLLAEIRDLLKNGALK